MNNQQTWKNKEKENSNDIHINKIQKAYIRIDKDWLWLHYKISVGLVIFACVVECIMGIILVNTDMMTTTVPRYIGKFILTPSIVNVIFILIDMLVVKSKRFMQNQKIYTVSLIFVAICFVLFTVHSAFVTTYYMFAVAIMMTIIYASYLVTIITALTSILSIIISELFIKWDVDKVSIFKSTLRLGDFLCAIFILIAFSIVSMVAIRYERKKNEASIQMEIERYQLQQSIQVDEMTGIFNRKGFQNALKDMEDNATKNNYILAIVDIDNFKGINDNWGHHMGDCCLIEFARVLRENCGKSVPFRFGGDEFCLLFHNADMAEAILTCEQINAELNHLQLEEHLILKLTASFGLAVYTEQMSATRLIIHADHALYEAKEDRNSICVFQEN